MIRLALFWLSWIRIRMNADPVAMELAKIITLKIYGRFSKMISVLCLRWYEIIKATMLVCLKL
jgi:hypothetical protein